MSRKNVVYKSFARLAAALSELHVKNVILDGELVSLGSDGRSQFMNLMRRRTHDALYYVFDLLWLDGQDLRSLPLIERKAALAPILKLSKIPALLYADHVEHIGTSFFKAVCEKDCEGIVGKHMLGTYSTSPNSWVKVINPDYSQHRGRREMFDKFRTRSQEVRA